jgi:hypothetical protein
VRFCEQQYADDGWGGHAALNPPQAEFCMTSEAGGGIGGRLQSYAGLDGDIYLRGGGGPEATGVLNTGEARHSKTLVNQQQRVVICMNSWACLMPQTSFRQECL